VTSDNIYSTIVEGSPLKDNTAYYYFETTMTSPTSPSAAGHRLHDSIIYSILIPPAHPRARRRPAMSVEYVTPSGVSKLGPGAGHGGPNKQKPAPIFVLVN
jgi:hypothetical protein